MPERNPAPERRERTARRASGRDHRRADDADRRAMRQVLCGVVVLGVLVVLFRMTSAPSPFETSEVGAAPPAERPAGLTAAEDGGSGESAPGQPYHWATGDGRGGEDSAADVSDPDLPRGAVSLWVRVTARIDPDAPASAEGEYRGQNGLVLTTANAAGLRLDLTRFDVDRTRGVVLQIDGQDLLLFPHHIDAVRLARTPEGLWTGDDP